MLSTIKSALEEALSIEIRRKSRLAGTPQETFGSYAAAMQACPTTVGYEYSVLVDVVFEKTQLYAAALESSVPTLSPPQSFALSILLLLSRKRGSVAVIDFGGACGAHYLLLRKLLGPQTVLKWHVVETPQMVSRAKAFADGELMFYETIGQALAGFASGGGVDLVFTSSALQYTDDPCGHLEQLLAIKADHIAFLRSNMTLGDHDEIRIQKSLLSANGIGPLPAGFTDCDIYYPVTSIQKKKFDQNLLKAGYRQLLAFDDFLELVNNTRVGFAGLFTRQ